MLDSDKIEGNKEDCRSGGHCVEGKAHPSLLGSDGLSRLGAHKVEGHALSCGSGSHKVESDNGSGRSGRHCVEGDAPPSLLGSDGRSGSHCIEGNAHVQLLGSDTVRSHSGAGGNGSGLLLGDSPQVLAGSCGADGIVNAEAFDSTKTSGVFAGLGVNSTAEPVLAKGVGAVSVSSDSSNANIQSGQTSVASGVPGDWVTSGFGSSSFMITGETTCVGLGKADRHTGSFGISKQPNAVIKHVSFSEFSSLKLFNSDQPEEILRTLGSFV